MKFVQIKVCFVKLLHIYIQNYINYNVVLQTLYYKFLYYYLFIPHKHNQL